MRVEGTLLEMLLVQNFASLSPSNHLPTQPDRCRRLLSAEIATSSVAAFLGTVDDKPGEGSIALTISESMSAKVPIVAALGEAPSEPVLQPPNSPSKTSPSSVSPPSPKVSSASININN